MDSLTKGSGIAVSVLVAATASVLLLLPGHPRAGSWRGPGTSGGVVVASAAATSSSGTPPGPGRRHPAASTPAPDRPAAGSRPFCRATGRTAAGSGPPRPARRIAAASLRRSGPDGAVPPGRTVTRRVPGGYRHTTESAQTCPDEF
jgi:hypothetical protein